MLYISSFTPRGVEHHHCCYEKRFLNIIRIGQVQAPLAILHVDCVTTSWNSWTPFAPASSAHQVWGVPGQPNSWLAGCQLCYVALGPLSPQTLSVYDVLKYGEGFRWEGVAGRWRETLVQSPIGEVSG